MGYGMAKQGTTLRVYTHTTLWVHKTHGTHTHTTVRETTLWVHNTQGSTQHIQGAKESCVSLMNSVIWNNSKNKRMVSNVFFPFY